MLLFTSSLCSMVTGTYTVHTHTHTRSITRIHTYIHKQIHWYWHQCIMFALNPYDITQSLEVKYSQHHKSTVCVTIKKKKKKKRREEKKKHTSNSMLYKQILYASNKGLRLFRRKEKKKNGSDLWHRMQMKYEPKINSHLFLVAIFRSKLSVAIWLVEMKKLAKIPFHFEWYDMLKNNKHVNGYEVLFAT